MAAITVQALDAKHPKWQECARFWEDIDLLYAGGWRIKQAASRFLVARPVEPSQVYAARLARFSYENILATVTGWYGSRLWAEEPRITIQGGDDYLSEFLADADRAGTSLIDLARGWFRSLVLHGSFYVLVDLPNQPLAANFLEQKTSGALDAYLVTFAAPQVINWGEDAYGNLDWLVIATQGGGQVFGEEKPRIVDRWYYFDRQTYRIWEATRPEGSAAQGDMAREVEMMAEGRHALADQNRVPVIRVTAPEDLWLAYRIYPQILDHLNQDNALAWALFMACLAVPVITGDYEEPPKLSETAYIKLAKGSTFAWSEPAGTSFAHAADRVQSLREEIYRQSHLQSQGRTSQATPAAASGYSKEMDMRPSHDVLNGYGAIFRAAFREIVSAVLSIRDRRDATVEVDGLTFQAPDELAEAGTAQAVLDMGIPSPTFERLVFRRLVRGYAANADQATRDLIDAEIEKGPTPSQRSEQQRRERAASFDVALQSRMKAPEEEES